MNWVRGFFRLWIIAGLLWLAITAVFLRPEGVVEAYASNVYQLIVHPIMMVRAESKRSKIEQIQFERQVVPSCKDFTPPAEVKEPHMTSSDELDRVLCSSARKTLNEETAEDRDLEPFVSTLAELDHSGQNLRTFCVTAFLPPVAILLLGISLAWALRGFTPK